jgi:UDP-N-acetylmuramoyl-tripeptide--D-alanyl-D-alanine ligase
VAACAVGHALEIPPHAIQAGLAGFAGVPGRLQQRRAASGAAVIDDTYNANPESMKAAIAVLAREPGRRVFAMGDMGELGAEAGAMHAEVGTYARTMGIDRCSRSARTASARWRHSARALRISPTSTR